MNIKVSALEPRWFLVFAFFVAGIFLGGLGEYILSFVLTQQSYSIHSAASYYKYINPLLAVDLQEGQKFSENSSIKLVLEGIISTQEKNKIITAVSVYFNNLQGGEWVEINGKETFSSGKLLKIPLMIAFYKLAQYNPDILSQKVTVGAADLTARSLIKPVNPLIVGETYTIDDLIDHMIIDNDGNAANLLFDRIDTNSLNEIFSDLGINFREEKDTLDFISLKLYSLFFKILYNATYLNRAYSEKALTLLDQADSTVGLGSQLPKNIPMPDRFGARPLNNSSNSPSGFEVYECGIIYYPSHPYLLCATAEGNDLKQLRDFFGEIGQKVYQEVKYQYPVALK